MGSSCLTKYKNTKRKVLGNDHKILNECSVEFDSILRNTCCAESYRAVISMLSKRDNMMSVNCKGNDVYVLPIMYVSDSVTNSLHYDKGDG